jgi:hypothetical protein
MSVLAPKSGNSFFLHDEALGRAPNVSARKIYGLNPDVDSGTVPENIWPPGGLFTYPETAQRVRVAAGGNAADTLAGAGAQKVWVEGLDENWDIITETLETAGASASSYTTQSFLRILDFKVLQTGTYHENNTGDVVLQDEGAGDTWAQISAGAGRAWHGFFSVPRGYMALMSRFQVGAARGATSGGTAEVSICLTKNANITNLAVRENILTLSTGAGRSDAEQAEVHFAFPAYTDVCARATYASANDLRITVNWDVELYKL